MKKLVKIILPVLMFTFNLNPQDKSKFYSLSQDFRLNDHSIYEYQSNGSLTGTGDTGYVGTNYLPQHEGNLYQYITHGDIDWWDMHVKTFQRDTLDPRYYYNRITHKWERYSEADKMIYVRRYTNIRESLFMDFNKAPGEEFLQYEPYADSLFWRAKVYGG